jgi:hypothetical protein
MPTFPLYPGRVTRWKVPGSLTGLVNYSIHPRQDEQAVELGRLLEGITNGIKRTLVFQANFITINSKGRILLFEIIDRLIYIFTL